MDGEEAFTLVLDDPSGNSYIESPGDTHDSKDPLLRLERYERTPEQAAGIGLLPPEPAGKHLCMCRRHFLPCRCDHMIATPLFGLDPAVTCIIYG